MKILSKIIAVIFTVSIFLICGFVAIIGPATSKAFYRAQFEKESIFGGTVLEDVRAQYEYLDDEKAREFVKNMSAKELLNLMMHTMKYCLFLEDDLNPTIGGERLEVFREDEYSHMEDVKNVFGGGIIIVGVALVFAIAISVLFIKRKKQYYENARKVPYFTLIGVFSVLAIIGLAAAIDFDTAFRIFHEIFFDGNWTFASGVMISMIGGIFLDLVPIILAVWVILLGLFVFGVWQINRWLKKKYDVQSNV